MHFDKVLPLHFILLITANNVGKLLVTFAPLLQSQHLHKSAPKFYTKYKKTLNLSLDFS